MKGLDTFDPTYFLKFRTTPVRLRPYRDKQTRIGKQYINRLQRLLQGTYAHIAIRGSTVFKILGKGEVEVGVYVGLKKWKLVLKRMTKVFGKPEIVEKNYVRFNDYPRDEEEVELIVLTGKEATLDRKLHAYLLRHPKLVKQYVSVKKKYAFSKREYQRHKDLFLRQVINKI